MNEKRAFKSAFFWVFGGISLFHYRNQGADYGRLLVGIQVAPKDNKAFEKFLKTLGYPYAKETDNPVYRLFLRG